MGVSDIPIIPCDREQAELNGAEIDRCILPWEWSLKGMEYVESGVSLEEVYLRNGTEYSVCEIKKPNAS